MKYPAIELKNVSFAAGHRNILKNLCLAVNQGEIISIIGPNGAGKTTLLKCLIRIHETKQDAIMVMGKPISAYTQKNLARKISYVPQGSSGPLPFSVQEFVMMGRYPYQTPLSRPTQKDKDSVTKALALTGICKLKTRFMDSLSGGERQRVFIAAALAQDTEILLLDEAGVFLDPVHNIGIHELLGQINTERGTTIILVTHDINMAILTSHRILALKNGRMAYWGTPEKLVEKQVLYHIYEKEFLLVNHPETGQKLVIPEIH